MIRIKWPVVLATLFLGLLGWYVIYPQSIVDELHQNEERMSEVFRLVQELIQDTGGPETSGALFDLQDVVVRSAIPFVILNPEDSVLSAENLPFDADVFTTEGQEQVKTYVGELDAMGREPVRGAAGDLIYFGETPELAGLDVRELNQGAGGSVTSGGDGNFRSVRFDGALFDLTGVVIRSGIPMIWTDPGDSVLSVENLPFDADIFTTEGQEQVKAYVRGLDATGREPVRGAAGDLIYFGETPEASGLRVFPWLTATGLMLTALIGFLVIRYQRRAEQDKAWTAMARELAHQLGTPISSLKGWLEFMGLPVDERPEGLEGDVVAIGLEEDLIRLERISHRFELIGRDPDLETLDIREVVRDLEQYLQARLPRLASEVLLVVDVPKDMPEILGSEVLLSWALENVVKNALDALAGRGGEIQLKVRRGPSGWLHLRIHDTGPGVEPELRDKIFDPGVSGKARGWGVGLTLSRRIIEVTHKGHIFLLDTEGDGATFDIRLPTAQA